VSPTDSPRDKKNVALRKLKHFDTNGQLWRQDMSGKWEYWLALSVSSTTSVFILRFMVKLLCTWSSSGAFVHYRLTSGPPDRIKNSKHIPKWIFRQLFQSKASLNTKLYNENSDVLCLFIWKPPNLNLFNTHEGRAVLHNTTILKHIRVTVGDVWNKLRLRSYRRRNTEPKCRWY
jgi:hypothetical protein